MHQNIYQLISIYQMNNLVKLFIRTFAYLIEFYFDYLRI